ncbi:MAG: carbonic anhydrase [Planctomycetia bacterium]|nr:carbonic anhydrase [Planctomycetia bacterium]
MLKLIRGVREFQSGVFPTQRQMFAHLAQGQHPEALFITCSDSRIDPNLITNTDPGEIFVLRNIGNIVPPHGTASDSEEAVIEYALVALGVKHIIICGHSHCGAMKGLLHPEGLTPVPAVASWLTHAEKTRRAVEKNHGQRHGDELLDAAVAENVIVQLDNLSTLPSVSSRLAGGEIRLHGWVYKIESGEILALNPGAGTFLPFDEAYRADF